MIRCAKARDLDHGVTKLVDGLDMFGIVWIYFFYFFSSMNFLFQVVSGLSAVLSSSD